MLARAVRKDKPDRVAELQAELEIPPFPESLRYLWRYYLRLRRRKSMGFASANPIEWPDILAFATLNRIELAPFELQLLEAVDDIYRNPGTKTPAPTPGKGKGVMDLASVRNPDGVKSLLRSFTGQRRAGGRVGRKKGG